jgi:type II secretory ATPase GspE/PulE/Tfp pilus assembly ATPase PilB-like protein
VLSTLHTNDAVAAVARMLDLGIPAFLVASSVTTIVAQRLVRKLCKCKEQVAMNPEYAARLLAAGIVDFGDKMYMPVGCDLCDNSGYKGRVGIYEVLSMDDQVRSAIRGTSRDEEVRNLARSGGMRLMQEDAMEKVKIGITTLEEAMRVVPFEHESSMRCRTCGKGLAPSFLFCPYCGSGTRQVSAAGRRPMAPAPVGTKGEAL